MSGWVNNVVIINWFHKCYLFYFLCAYRVGHGLLEHNALKFLIFKRNSFNNRATKNVILILTWKFWTIKEKAHNYFCVFPSSYPFLKVCNCAFGELLAVIDY